MPSPSGAVREREAPASRSLGPANLVVKIFLVGLIDALLILCIARSAADGWRLATVFFVVLLVVVNVVYFTGRALPLKYLLPGLAFLVVFQIYTMGYTAYASLTNYGTGHLGSQEDAVAAIQQQNVVPVPDAAAYPIVPIVKDGVVAFLITDPETGAVSIGTNDGLTEVADSDVQREGDLVVGVAGYERLTLAQLAGNEDYKAQFDALRPPIDEEAGTYLRSISATSATLAQSGFSYNPSTQTLTSAADGTVYEADQDRGNFVSEDGQRLNPGWQVNVGFDNYVNLLTDSSLRSRFLPILLWTFVFAILTTLLNFGLGLLLALVLSERRMRGQGAYRLLLIIPFGLPAILTTLVWKAMLNQDFGLVNQFLGVNVHWLTDPNLARFSVLMVNLWMGFPYFFLVCSGALTAIPADLKEAAYVDGASGRYAFRTVVLPLLLVATAPLLVTTFAFNFNNYTLIQLLTAGGPFPQSIDQGGSTDLLINYTFRTAFGSGQASSQQQLGLASAIAMVIFVVVGTVSAYGFRLTKRLEEIGR